MASSLLAHCGARHVTREELEPIAAPPPTDTWFPQKHAVVVDTVGQALERGGFRIEKAQYALSRNDNRLFATMDLEASLVSGVQLAVGIRNSIDKSLPLGFCAGSRCFVCDNLCFTSDLIVTRKHTRFGQVRFEEAICQAVQSLTQFRQVESERIRRFQRLDIDDQLAESLMLRAYEDGIVSHRLLPRVIREWRLPSFEDFRTGTLWSLSNAFTTVLGERAKSNPQQFAALTMRLQDLLDSAAAPQEIPYASAS